MKKSIPAFFLATIACSATLMIAQPAAAKGQDAELADLKQRLEEQEARVHDLEIELQQRAFATSNATRIAAPTLNASHSNSINNDMMRRIEALETSVADSPCEEESVWQEVHQGWDTKWGGRIMFDSVNWAAQDADSVARFGNQQNYAEFRRLRFFASGKGYGVYEYKLQLDFEPEGPLVGSTYADQISVRDAYIGMTNIPYLGKVRIGNMKEGFGLEELTSSKYITFMERALPVAFTPSRQVGIQAYNQTYDERFSWSYGAFFNDINQQSKQQIDDNQGIDLVGRLVWTPRYEANGRFLTHLGVGGIYRDDRDNSARFRARPEIHEGDRWVDTGTIALDEGYTTLNAEYAKVCGPLSLQGEFFWTKVDHAAGGSSDLYGAYFYASYFLTGENRAYDRSSGTFGRVKPFTNFWVVRTCDGPSMGWGAWEAAVRWSYVDFEDAGITGANRGELHNITAGLNWHWNPHARMMFNYIHTMGDYATGGGKTDGDILAMRWQVDF